MIPICSMDEIRIPSIYASREDPESESRISRDSILLFFLSFWTASSGSRARSE
jgi:hypothetical protein